MRLIRNWKQRTFKMLRKIYEQNPYHVHYYYRYKDDIETESDILEGVGANENGIKHSSVGSGFYIGLEKPVRIAKRNDFDYIYKILTRRKVFITVGVEIVRQTEPGTFIVKYFSRYLILKTDPIEVRLSIDRDSYWFYVYSDSKLGLPLTTAQFYIPSKTDLLVEML